MVRFLSVSRDWLLVWS